MGAACAGARVVAAVNRRGFRWLPRRMLPVPWWLPFGAVPEIGAADLARSIRASVPPLLLDVRSPGEWQSGHIARTLNVPISRLRVELEAMRLDPERPIVAICLSGHRSVPAVRLLARRGYRAHHLRGGMLAWRQAGLPTVTAAAAR